MLEAINLSKSYKDFEALSNFNLKVQPGEIYCLLGANGAGKTTTVNLFMGFINPSEGQVKVNNMEVSASSSLKREIAYIPENLNLYKNLSGIENLQYFSGLGGKQLDKKSAKDLLQTVGLDSGATKKRVSTYSKGMRQKVGIAIAKAKQAKYLILDEPTSGLDPQASNDFAQLLKELRESNVAILMATHDLFRAKESGTHIGIMKAGRLIHTLESSEIGLHDLENLYLETMR